MSESKINAYTCSNRHRTITIDLVEGVTPFMIRCPHPGCQEMAQSCMYQTGQKQQPTHEWYKPTEEEMHKEAEVSFESYKQTPLYLSSTDDDRLALDDIYGRIKDHVDKGGLMLRKIQNSDTIFYKVVLPADGLKMRKRIWHPGFGWGSVRLPSAGGTCLVEFDFNSVTYNNGRQGRATYRKESGGNVVNCPTNQLFEREYSYSELPNYAQSLVDTMDAMIS